MTYAAGFRTEHGIYLTVDSAATGEKDTAIHSDTFFGEQALHETYDITDNAMKIFQIDSHRLVAAAGVSDAIYRSIDFLREYTTFYNKASDLFACLQNSLAIPDGAIELIFAEYTQDGFELGVWRSGQKYESPRNKNGCSPSAISIGSGIVFDYLTNNIAESIRSITKKTINNNMAFISCCHQLHGVHEDHTLKNVGGAFITVALTEEGVVWQPDITYFKYSPSLMRNTESEKEKLRMFYPVNVLVREGSVFVERRVPEYRSTFMGNAIKQEKRTKIKERHGKEIEKKSLNLSCEYGAFLSSEEPYAVLIHNFSGEYCYKSVISKNTARTSFSEDIYEKLLEKPNLPNIQGAMSVFCAPENFLKPDYTLPDLKPHGT